MISKVVKKKLHLHTNWPPTVTFRLHLYSFNSAVTSGATDHKTYGLDHIMVSELDYFSDKENVICQFVNIFNWVLFVYFQFLF